LKDLSLSFPDRVSFNVKKGREKQSCGILWRI
jgi:hypothetical protein